MFWALVIYTDHHIAKMWLNDEQALSLISSDETASIYRTGTDQYAIVTDQNTLAWVDLRETKFENK